ncbi:hypothetical protein SO802_027443 [Lithocarpus litseifolius]|uniref:Cathepsin propeptide inhibitor domain-containing protein n=1 Tax=Lithocarpus litseifolius TaxID=425828 RepID=A0AAW2C416_9ROSI
MEWLSRWIMPVLDRDWRDWSSETRSELKELVEVEMRRREMRRRRGREFGVFKVNLRRAKVQQKLDPSAEHGVTKFSDLTPAEFRRNFLWLKRLRLPSNAQKAPILPTDDLPTDFDWRDYCVVTGVKDQVIL